MTTTAQNASWLKSRCSETSIASCNLVATPLEPDHAQDRLEPLRIALPSERKCPHVSATAAVTNTTTILRSVAGVVAACASASARTSVTNVRHNRRGHDSPGDRVAPVPVGEPGSAGIRVGVAGWSTRPPPSETTRPPRTYRRRRAPSSPSRTRRVRTPGTPPRPRHRRVGRIDRAAPTWGSGVRRRVRPTCEYGTCSVSVTSGAIALTRTPCAAYSTASERVKPVIAALNAE